MDNCVNFPILTIIILVCGFMGVLVCSIGHTEGYADACADACYPNAMAVETRRARTCVCATPTGSVMAWGKPGETQP
jgi:hypothetical protein